MVHNALQYVVNECTGYQPVKDTLALLALLLDIAFTLALEDEIRGICRLFVHLNCLRDDKVIIDMYAGFVCPAKPDILAITDDDANCFPMIIIIRIQQILIRDIAVTPNLLSGTAQAYQNHTSLIGSEGVERDRGVLEERLKHADVFPLDRVEGSQTAKVFVKKTQLLMDDDRLFVRRLLATADFAKFDDLTGIAADSIDLRVQQVNLSLQLVLHFFHLALFLVELCHELFFLGIEFRLDGIHLCLQFCKLTGSGVLGIIQSLFQFRHSIFVGLELLVQTCFRQGVLSTGWNQSSIAFLSGRPKRGSQGRRRHIRIVFRRDSCDIFLGLTEYETLAGVSHVDVGQLPGEPLADIQGLLEFLSKRQKLA